MTEPPDDPQLAADIAEAHAFLAGVGRLIERSRGRVLTAAEIAQLGKIRAVLAEFTFVFAPDEASALRSIVGEQREGRA